MTKLSLESKYLGAMIGSAVGDAIGELAFHYPNRNKLNQAIQGVTELRYTDDTAMAIGLATSLVRKGYLDGQDLGETFRRNFEQEPWRGYAAGPPTVFTMAGSLEIPYVLAAQSLFGGSGSFGNGAAMRIAPLGLFFHNSLQIYEHACDSAEVTHSHPVGKDGAAIQARAVAQAVKHDPQEKFRENLFIRDLVNFSRTNEIRKKIELVEDLLSRNTTPLLAAKQLGQSVAVQESMPFAIYSFLRCPHSFEDCIDCAIMHGGDRDTLGAMAGAISGAFLGVEAIPSGWRRKLENRQTIEALALELARKTLSTKD